MKDEIQLKYEVVIAENEQIKTDYEELK